MLTYGCREIWVGRVIGINKGRIMRREHSEVVGSWRWVKQQKKKAQWMTQKTNGTDISLNIIHVHTCAFLPQAARVLSPSPTPPLTYSVNIMATPAAPHCPRARVLWLLYLVPMCWPQLPSGYLVERYETELGHKVALTKRIKPLNISQIKLLRVLNALRVELQSRRKPSP